VRSVFDFQMAVWGYAEEGVRDITAFISEHPFAIGHTPAWDHPEGRDNTTINGEPLPEWMACYWLGEHVRRGHAVLPLG
jgi:hypothetical protein